MMCERDETCNAFSQNEDNAALCMLGVHDEAGNNRQTGKVVIIDVKCSGDPQERDVTWIVRTTTIDPSNLFYIIVVTKFQNQNCNLTFQKQTDKCFWKQDPAILAFCPSVCRSVCLSVALSMCLALCLSCCLHVCLTF